MTRFSKSILILSMLLTVSGAQAALTSYAGEFTINATGGASTFVVGDIFEFQFEIDDSTIDTQSATFIGGFTSALNSVQLSRSAGNTGTWDPAAGAFLLPPDNFATQASIERLSIGISGAGFPAVDGFSIFSMSLSFWDGAPGTINDTGSGQTLAQQLGGPFDPFDFATRNALLGFRKGISSLLVTGEITSITATPISAVPIPATVWLFGSALGLLGWIQRRAT